jgi:SAM-dependent methyltransferase
MKRVPPQTDQLGKEASPFARQCLRRIGFSKGVRVLDVPCGFGRHSVWLASMGHKITAIDIDPERVAATKKALAEASDPHSVRCIVADAEKPLPVPANTFDLAIVMHYYAPGIFETVARALKPDGYLIFETFGAQGDNWLALPEFGLVPKLLRLHFEPLRLRERQSGPQQKTAVVHALAIKRD